MVLSKTKVLLSMLGGLVAVSVGVNAWHFSTKGPGYEEIVAVDRAVGMCGRPAEVKGDEGSMYSENRQSAFSGWSAT